MFESNECPTCKQIQKIASAILVAFGILFVIELGWVYSKILGIQ